MSEIQLAHLTHSLRRLKAQIRDIEAVRYPSIAQVRFLAVLQARQVRLEEAIELEKVQLDLFQEGPDAA